MKATPEPDPVRAALGEAQELLAIALPVTSNDDMVMVGKIAARDCLVRLREVLTAEER